MSITATELKSNLGKYLLLAATEDIFITRNGKVVAKLSNPHQDRVDIAKSLFGILPSDVTLEEAKEERLNRIWELSLIPASLWTPCKAVSRSAKMRSRFFCSVPIGSLMAS